MDKIGLMLFQRNAASNSYSMIHNAERMFGASDHQVLSLFNDMLSLNSEDEVSYSTFLINPEDKETFLKSNRELFEKMFSMCQIRFRRLDGEFVWCGVIRTLSEEDGARVITGGLLDVTDTRNMVVNRYIKEYVRTFGEIFFEIFTLDFTDDSMKLLMTKKKDTSAIDFQLPIKSAIAYLVDRDVISADRKKVTEFFYKDYIKRAFQERKIPEITYTALGPDGKYGKRTAVLTEGQPGQYFCCVRLLSQTVTAPPVSLFHSTGRLEKELTGFLMDNVLLAARFDLVTEIRISTEYDVIPPDAPKILFPRALIEYACDNLEEEDSKELFKRYREIRVIAESGKEKRAIRTLEGRRKNTGSPLEESDWLEINLCYFQNDLQEHANLFVFMKDISQKKKEEEKTFGLAREDSLTGLMNREAFTRQCEKFLNERALARSKTALSALLVIELTDFKKINDAYGRAYGDKAIRHTADVMRMIKRPGDFISRFSGGVFVTFINEVHSRDALSEYVNIITNALRYHVISGEILSARAGAAIYPVDGKTFDELYEKASKELLKTGIIEDPEKSDVLRTEPAAPIRHEPREKDIRKVRIRTFGFFDVFVNGAAIPFKQEKAKELLALLVDRQGGYLTAREAISYLWEDEEANKTTLARYRKVAMRLRISLEEYGVSNIIESRNGERRIVQDKVKCDLFEYQSGEERYKTLFNGSYMTNYSWGEITLANLLYKGSTDTDN